MGGNGFQWGFELKVKGFWKVDLLVRWFSDLVDGGTGEREGFCGDVGG